MSDMKKAFVRAIKNHVHGRGMNVERFRKFVEKRTGERSTVANTVVFITRRPGR
jgi:hypothetical protein